MDLDYEEIHFNKHTLPHPLSYKTIYSIDESIKIWLNETMNENKKIKTKFLLVDDV